MSNLVSRILLSIFMFPLAGIFYIFMAVAVSEHMRGSNARETGMFLFCGGFTWMFVAVYWYLLWRSSVKWNSDRITRTWLSAGGALLAGTIAGSVAAALVRSAGSSFGAFVGSVLAIIIWLIATVFIWRESPDERAGRIKNAGNAGITCPTCGYNLTGLSESRCPECGSKFTLDELVALQPRPQLEIEQ